MKSFTKTVLGVAAFVILTMSPTTVSAQVSVEDQIQTLKAELQRLQGILAQRLQYAESGATTEGALDYFYLKTEAESPVKLYGNEQTDVVFTADLDVLQLFLVTDCNEADSRLFGWDSCSEKTWITGTEKSEWTHTFTIPFSVVSGDDETSATYEVYACRFNGCMLETELDIVHKPALVFTDEVKISDRYDWEYNNEKDDLIYEQEVLIRFPHSDIRKVIIDVRCENEDLYLYTTTRERISCSDDQTYDSVNYNKVKSDEAGNEYNMLVYTVFENFTKESIGSVELEVSFYSKTNKFLGSIKHTPQQKAIVKEETEE